MATTFLNTKISEVENKIPNHDKYDKHDYSWIELVNNITLCNKIKLVTKIEFDNKLISFNRKIISNKARYLEL